MNDGENKALKQGRDLNLAEQTYIKDQNPLFGWSHQMTQADFDLAHSWYYLFYQEKTGHLIGYIGFHQVLDEAMINTVLIDEAYRGQGYGQQMMTGFLKSLNQVESVILEVRQRNKLAGYFYKKMGFEVIDMRANYYRDPVDDAVVMRFDFEKE